MTTKTDLATAKRALGESLTALDERETLTNVAAVMLAIRGVSDALGYKYSYGKSVEYDVTDSCFKVHARVADDDYTPLPGMSTTLPVDDKKARLRAISELASAVLALPTLVEYKRSKWREEMLVLAEKGEALNIGFEYTAMLRATAEKLATNIITHRPANDDTVTPIRPGRSVDLT